MRCMKNSAYLYLYQMTKRPSDGMVRAYFCEIYQYYVLVKYLTTAIPFLFPAPQLASAGATHSGARAARTQHLRRLQACSAAGQGDPPEAKSATSAVPGDASLGLVRLLPVCFLLASGTSHSHLFVVALKPCSCF